MTSHQTSPVNRVQRERERERRVCERERRAKKVWRSSDEEGRQAGNTATV